MILTIFITGALVLFIANCWASAISRTATRNHAALTPITPPLPVAHVAIPARTRRSRRGTVRTDAQPAQNRSGL